MTIFLRPVAKLILLRILHHRVRSIHKAQLINAATDPEVPGSIPGTTTKPRDDN
jgi:hypothetical protein